VYALSISLYLPTQLELRRPLHPSALQDLRDAATYAQIRRHSPLLSGVHPTLYSATP
jgi:hypothetical protein